MTTTTKGILAIVGAVLVAWAIWGAYQYPQAQPQQQLAGTSAVGSTFSNAKYYAINAAFTSGTSTSILNGDANDRIVTSLRYACSGIGTSQRGFVGGGLNQWVLQAATSSSATASTTNTNLVFNTAIPTTTVLAQMSSSTQVLGGNFPNNIWASGSYLVFYANATNTAACTVGVDVLAT